MTLAGWSVAGHGDQTKEGRCRLGQMSRIISSSLRGRRHPSQWSSEFTRELVKLRLGGEVYASSEMLEHLALSNEFRASLARSSPGMVGVETL